MGIRKIIDLEKYFLSSTDLRFGEINFFISNLRL